LDSQPLQRAIEDILITKLSGSDSKKFQELLERYIGLVLNTKDFSRWQSLEFWLSSWQILFSGEDIEAQTVTRISQAVSQSPYHLKAYYIRGRYHEIRGDFVGAMQDYLHVFSLDVFFLDVKPRLSKLMKDHGRENEVALVEHFFDSEVTRFQHRDLPKSVQKGYDLVSKLQDNGPKELLLEARYNLAFLLRVQLSRHQEAIEVLSEILSQDYSLREEQSLYHLGMAKLYLNDLKGSDKAFARLLDRYPSHEYQGRVELLRMMIRILKLVRNVWEDDSVVAKT
jgi:tetratricopeptide (TPR) repeat protein